MDVMERRFMRESVFSTLAEYLKAVSRGCASVFSSCCSTFPYIFGIGELRKKVTEQYPDPVSSRTEDDLPPRTRGLLFNDINKCTGCGECQKICPVQCIKIETAAGMDLSRTQITVFDIDLGKCMLCGLCVEVCHPMSLTHTKKFEGSAYLLEDLVLSFGKGKESYDRS